MDLLSLVVAFCSCLVPAYASSMSADSEGIDYDSPFYYDYESLRIGGLVFAVTLFILGIVLIFSRKCQCKSSKPARADPESAIMRS
ncbi:FXYD domain containing ion transport regulator 6 like isoform X2 [Engraulis encrasicolus]|uniref:FXYD domain containing ion transport regulator 6 like isoform X2 n=1 Tax=Engraulis encrasicolus TaxID=184585 RepID=UPI002FD6E5CF